MTHTEVRFRTIDTHCDRTRTQSLVFLRRRKGSLYRDEHTGCAMILKLAMTAESKLDFIGALAIWVYIRTTVKVATGDDSNSLAAVIPVGDM